MQNAAEIRHLSKVYGEHTVVRDLSFTIPSGGVVGLIGPNGAGKTTTMKMLLGLVSRSRGDVQLLGTPLGAPGWGATLKRIGSMIEEPPIYLRMSARENLEYQFLAVTGKIDGDKIEQLLTLVDLADRADDRPRGYSLGMKQRLGIATALVGDPELIILDEPANGLDPAGIREIRRLLRRLPETGATVLVSSHQLAEVQQACDQLIIIADGACIAQGTTEEILAQGRSNLLVVDVPAQQLETAITAMATASIEVTSTEAVSTETNRLTVEVPSGFDGGVVNRRLVESGVFATSLSQPTVSLEEAFLDMVDSTPTSTNPTPDKPVLANTGAAS